MSTITKEMKLFKVLNTDGSCYWGGAGSWFLPKGKRPGKWMPRIASELKPCERGYHLLREQDLVQWLGPAIFEAECRGDMIVSDDKVVCSQARLLRRLPFWNEKNSRLFSCDCAERVLPIFEKHRKGDDRPRRAVNTARMFAMGKADSEELAAARDAAWAAARDAAGDAALDAALDAAGDAAWDEAGAAAWDAAGAAAWDEAGAAAWDEEREWQTKRLMEYLEGKDQCENQR